MPGQPIFEDIPPVSPEDSGIGVAVTFDRYGTLFDLQPQVPLVFALCTEFAGSHAPLPLNELPKRRGFGVADAASDRLEGQSGGLHHLDRPFGPEALQEVDRRHAGDAPNPACKGSRRHPRYRSEGRHIDAPLDMIARPRLHPRDAIVPRGIRLIAI